ncbi:MAG TPA: HAD-IIIC family phosphatase, partial [Chthoniobacterales bacterium]
MNLLQQWIRDFSDESREAVVAAFESGSLAKARRALRLLQSDRADAPALHVELLGTFSLEPLQPFLQLALECLPSAAEIQLAPLDSIEAHLAHPSTSMPAGASARVIVWRLEEVLPEALYPFTHGFPHAIEARVSQLLERAERLVGMHQRNAPGVPLFLSTLALPAYFSQPLFAAQHHAGVMGAVARVNQRIYELASRGDGVHVLDLASWAAHEGRDHSDAMLDFAARQPFSAKGQASFALFLARTLRPLVVPRRKVLAVDLDNTLWGGVVGEDGIAGLKLGHDFPGNVHLRIQRELLELRNRGVLLVLLSKNNEADAREAFEALPDMLLKWDDFALRKV